MRSRKYACGVCCAFLELAREHRAKDLQRNAAVGEDASGLVLELDRERFLIGRYGRAEAAEADAAGQLQKLPKCHARFPCIAVPGCNRACDRLVEFQQAILVRGDRRDAPKAFRSAIERVRFLGVPAFGVALENGPAISPDDQHLQGVARRILRGSFDVQGAGSASGSRARTAAMASRIAPPARSTISAAWLAAAERRNRSAASV